MTPDPALPEPFTWEGEHIAVQAPGGEALFTTRREGLETVAQQIGIAEQYWARGRQVHEADVRRVRGLGDLQARDADGQATVVPGVACVVLVADCLPVALLAEGAVAMLHAGWRGLAAGVLEEGVQALRELGASGDVVAAIGPGAGGCCYEVGDEVRRVFGREGSGLLDLKAIAAGRLLAAGAIEVHDAGLCTLCSDPSLFFSHRRDGGVTGRQAGFAWRT